MYRLCSDSLYKSIKFILKSTYLVPTQNLGFLWHPHKSEESAKAEWERAAAAISRATECT